MIHVLQAGSTATLAATTSHLHAHGGHSHVGSLLAIPSWPALVLAAISIASKEWLFQVTKRVGESLNSQILIANAWYDIAYKMSRYSLSLFHFQSFLQLHRTILTY